MKISHTKVSTGIYKKDKGHYVFRVDRGSASTVAWRHQKKVTGVNDKQAIALFKEWIEAELEAYEKARAEIEKSKLRANGSTILSFRQYTSVGDIPAHDGPFLMQLKKEATTDKAKGNRRRVGSLQTAQGMKSTLRQINANYPKFANKPLNVISPDDIDDLLDQIKADRGVTNNTLNHHLHTISKVFTLAQEAKLVPKRFNPCHEVSGRLKEYREKTIITASQYAKVADAIMKLNPIPKAGLLISLLCGLRREELAGLTWDEVDFEHSVLNIRHTIIEYKAESGKTVKTIKKGTKNGSVRTVGLPDLAKDALYYYWTSLPDKTQTWVDEVTGKEYAMCWQYPNGQGLYCIDYFGHMWRILRKELIADGVLNQKARFHDLRGGFITFMLNRQHVSPVIVAALAGHKSAKMTLDVYGQSDDEDIKDALTVMNGALK